MIDSTSPLLILAIVLAGGVICGAIANRMHLPSVTGQILYGILIGPSALGLFPMGAVHDLLPITQFALGLIAVSVGSHLNFRKLGNAYKRLGLLLLFESVLTPLLVFSTLMLIPGISWTLALLLGVMAISTAPATILAIVRETRAKGILVKTLMAAVALNNIACIFLFEIAHVSVRAYLDPELSHTARDMILVPLGQLLGSILIGSGIGLVLVLVTRKVLRRDKLASASIIAILLTLGLAHHFGISTLFSSLILGMTLANLAPDKENIGHTVFDNLENALFAIFFTAAGMELDLAYVLTGGLLALLVVGLRTAGKVASAGIAMKIAGETKRLSRNLGLALVPQAGIAVGLILLVQKDPAFREIRDLLLAVGLTSVLLNEIIGPILARFALKNTGEIGQDRARLIDFLHEENITTALNGETKEEAIAQLTDLLIHSNNLNIDRDRLMNSVLNREREFSTCIGSGLAIPHGLLEKGDRIYGAMGISRKGLNLETPDGQPVHCMVLLATPKTQRDRHLEVLAALARTFGNNHSLRNLLYNAKTPSRACYILTAEEFIDMNYFLDENKRTPPCETCGSPDGKGPRKPSPLKPKEF